MKSFKDYFINEAPEHFQSFDVKILKNDYGLDCKAKLTINQNKKYFGNWFDLSKLDCYFYIRPKSEGMYMTQPESRDYLGNYSFYVYVYLVGTETTPPIEFLDKINFPVAKSKNNIGANKPGMLAAFPLSEKHLNEIKSGKKYKTDTTSKVGIGYPEIKFKGIGHISFKDFRVEIEFN